ncbi:hypothetical protein T492DRAFT_335778 [Pavlovales sp. CCMP2436]|nr:hypothetical protein T492DRAFT_335778 [Pavlovales sp. CCMP2436]
MHGAGESDAMAGRAPSLNVAVGEGGGTLEVPRTSAVHFGWGVPSLEEPLLKTAAGVAGSAEAVGGRGEARRLVWVLRAEGAGGGCASVQLRVRWAAAAGGHFGTPPAESDTGQSGVAEESDKSGIAQSGIAESGRGGAESGGPLFAACAAAISALARLPLARQRAPPQLSAMLPPNFKAQAAPLGLVASAPSGQNGCERLCEHAARACGSTLLCWGALAARAPCAPTSGWLPAAPVAQSAAAQSAASDWLPKPHLESVGCASAGQGVSASQLSEEDQPASQSARLDGGGSQPLPRCEREGARLRVRGGGFGGVRLLAAWRAVPGDTNHHQNDKDAAPSLTLASVGEVSATLPAPVWLGAAECLVARAPAEPAAAAGAKGGGAQLVGWAKPASSPARRGSPAPTGMFIRVLYDQSTRCIALNCAFIFILFYFSCGYSRMNAKPNEVQHFPFEIPSSLSLIV